jgi:hypothetical protein
MPCPTGQRGREGQSGRAGCAGRPGRGMERSTAVDAPGLQAPLANPRWGEPAQVALPAGYVNLGGWVIRSVTAGAAAGGPLPSAQELVMGMGAANPGLRNAGDGKMLLGAAPARNVTPRDSRLPVRLGVPVGVLDDATKRAIAACKPRAGGLVLDRQGKRAFRLTRGDLGKRPSDKTPLTRGEVETVLRLVRREARSERPARGAFLVGEAMVRAGTKGLVNPAIYCRMREGARRGKHATRQDAVRRWTLRVLGRPVTARAIVAGWRLLAAAA